MLSTARKVRRADGDYVLVSRRDVVRVDNASRARALANEILGLADEREIARLAHDLQSGRRVLVRVRQKPPVLDPPQVVNLSDLIPDEPAQPLVEPERAHHWLQVRLIGSDGRPRIEASLEVSFGDGTTKQVQLDVAGSWRTDDIEGPGPCSLRLRSIGRPDPTKVLDGFEAKPDMPRATVGGAPVRLDLDQSHTIIVPVGAACVRLEGMSFALNKAFLLPSALEGIRLLRHMYESMPQAELLVVGHTDRSGSAGRNASLSLQRAEAIVAFLADDADAWLRFYDDAMDYSRRWGEAEDIEMLRSLPRDHAPYYGPHHETHSYEAAIIRFQEAHLLEPTGKADVATRRALIADYMALDGTTLPAETKVLAHGCGESFPRVDTADGEAAQENRRVEVFFFAEGVDPRPGASTSDSSSTDYAAWLERVEEERTFRPSEAGLGTLLIVTDVSPQDRERLDVTYRVFSTDGAYDRRFEVQEGRTGSEGVELLFEDMPTLSHYTLEVIEQDGDTTRVFEDVAYARLSTLSGTLDTDVVSPFGWKENRS